MKPVAPNIPRKPAPTVRPVQHKENTAQKVLHGKPVKPAWKDKKDGG